MEYITTCNLCCVKFDEDLCVPKMLDCGHSFCLSCIEKLIESSPSCPNCRKELIKDKLVKDYLTNYSLLEVKLVKPMEGQMESSPNLKEKNKIEIQKENLTKKISKISLNLEQAKCYLEKIQDFNDFESDNWNLKKAKMILASLETKEKMVRGILSDFQRLKLSVNIRFENHENSEDYLNKIYITLQKKEIYAVKNIEEVVKYGKVSFENNLLLFHALSETEKPDQASLIWFDDLKKCATEENFFTFLKLSCNEKGIIHLFTIKMLDNQLASQFITLCTGECGPTYKNCRYGKYDREDNSHFCRVIKLMNNEMSQSATESRIDYNTKKQNAVINEMGDQILSLKDDRHFVVNKLLSSMIVKDSAGILESPRNINDFISFKDDSKLIIVDCGILFKF